MKDIPRYVWNKKRNKAYFAIIKPEKLPPSRTFREAWRLKDFIKYGVDQ